MHINLMTPVGLRVLVLDGDRERARSTQRLLVEQGYAVADAVAPDEDLAEALSRAPADILMIYAPTADAALLAALKGLPQTLRVPTVLITEDGSSEEIYAAVEAGVNACVVVGVNGNRVRSAIDLAKANFSSHRGLREELDEARNALRERKLIERAKGIIMKERGLGEDEAYAFLRRRAMQRGQRLVTIAEMVNEAAELMQL
ncbi:MAG: ANTAR domain-containing protein [Rhodobacterales bacterium]|nr:ANTAR domain-containing protein [Rhodobacterales bacterium]